MKPILINNLEFAQKNLEISGDLSLSQCKRLAETVSTSDEKLATINYKLVGAANKMHLPSLRLSINAQLPVLCQRCLAQMQLEFSLNFDYVVSENEPTELKDSDDVDWLEATQNMDVGELIEDELLIAMPIAPAHETNCAKAKMESGEKPNPFAILKGKF